MEGNPNLQARAELNKCPDHFRFAWDRATIVLSDLQKKEKPKDKADWRDKE